MDMDSGHPKISAAIFPGLGSEYPGMLSCIADESVVAEIFGTLGDVAGSDLLAAAAGTNGGFADLRAAQLSVFGTSICYWHLLRERSQYTHIAGHSLGFYAALCAAGSVAFEDCAAIIMKVQDAIEKSSGGMPGLMASVIGMRTADVEALCRRVGSVYVSNVNSATQTVISGLADRTRAVCGEARTAGALSVKELSIPYALHSPLMQGIEDILSVSLADIEVRRPAVTVVSHLDGAALDAAGIRLTLADQLTRQVRWIDAVKALRQAGAERFVEVGPSDVLTKLVRWIERDADAHRAEELVTCQPR